MRGIGGASGSGGGMRSRSVAPGGSSRLSCSERRTRLMAVCEIEDSLSSSHPSGDSLGLPPSEGLSIHAEEAGTLLLRIEAVAGQDVPDLGSGEAVVGERHPAVTRTWGDWVESDEAQRVSLSGTGTGPRSTRGCRRFSGSGIPRSPTA